MFLTILKVLNSTRVMTDETQPLEIYHEQVSGKDPKLILPNKTSILKGYNAAQDVFYKTFQEYHLSHCYFAFSKSIPKYYGTLSLSQNPLLHLKGKHDEDVKTWLSHLASRYTKRNGDNKFIQLQNLTFGMEMANIFDIKIGGRNAQGKKNKITRSVLSFGMKLNGCKLNFIGNTSKSIFLSKYYLHEATSINQFIEYFGLFFFDGERVALQAVKRVREQLIDLILGFKAVRGFRFISSSICLIYDVRNKSHVLVKLIDFGRVCMCHPQFIDHEAIEGVENILKLVKQVEDNHHILLPRLVSLQKYYMQANITIIPEHKKEQQAMNLLHDIDELISKGQ